MKKIIILCLVFSSLFSSNDTASGKNREHEASSTNDMEEVLYEHLKEYKKNDRTIRVVTSDSNYYYIDNEKENNNNSSIVSKNNSEQNTTKAAERKHSSFQGYCFGAHKPIDVTRLSSYTYMKCNFDNVDAELATLLVPDAFSKALIGKPLYLSVNGKRYPVIGGAILNHDKTSINLANIVNDRKIETFIAETTVKAADIATTQAQAYMDAKLSAQTEQEAVYNSTDSTNQTIVVTNTEDPKISDYLANASIQLVSQLVKTGAEIFKEDLPYMFQTKANANVLDLMVTNQSSSLPNMNIEGTSITRNPTLEQSKTQSNISLEGTNKK